MSSRVLLGVFLLILLSGLAWATEPVTVRTFVRAETDRYIKNHVDRFGLGKFRHNRVVARIDDQRVIRMNRDTLYSAGTFDLSSPVTITKPDAGERFQSMHVLNQDHHTKMVAYEPGDYTLTRDTMGTRYVFVIFRTVVDADDWTDVKIVNELQDKILVQQANIGELKMPDWDHESLTRLREAINVLAATAEDNRSMFGDANSVDPIMHMLGAAFGWGGLPPQDAIYLSETPTANDGTTTHTLTVKDVPVDAFWSVSVYNEKGYFRKNIHDAYVINDRNSKKNWDGSVTIYFGGDPEEPNFLPITDGWNYTVRMYRPRKEVLDGSWKFPVASPIE